MFPHGGTRAVGTRRTPTSSRRRTKTQARELATPLSLPLGRSRRFRPWQSLALCRSRASLSTHRNPAAALPCALPRRQQTDFRSDHDGSGLWPTTALAGAPPQFLRISVSLADAILSDRDSTRKAGRAVSRRSRTPERTPQETPGTTIVSGTSQRTRFHDESTGRPDLVTRHSASVAEGRAARPRVAATAAEACARSAPR
jgi:hypothetical protein